jgi:hypothetical protein
VTNVAIIMFSLSVRVCGSLITETCHYEHVSSFTSEPLCRAAGRIMSVYPTVFGFKCRLETHPYQYRTGTGNPF